MGGVLPQNIMQLKQTKALPYDYQYDLKYTALLLIDFQKDFLMPGGFGELLGNDPALLQTAVEPVKNILKAFRKHKLPIFHTREGHQSDLSDCPPAKLNRGNSPKKIGDLGPMGRILITGEEGHEIINELKPIDSEIIIDKPGKGAFYKTNLDEQLKSKNIKYLIIAGVTTEVCVQSTVREANDRGYEVLVLEDCVASYKQELHKAALEMITSQNGILGWVTDSKTFLNSLK